MMFDFWSSAQEKILTVAHRGVSAGNIPCNTLPAYETALAQGADVIETDVEMSADGTLFVFHPGMERAQLGTDLCVSDLPAAEIRTLRYVNFDRTPTQFGLLAFDDLLETFKGRCYINVDKFWGHPKEIYEAIKRHGMTDQIVVKSAPSEEVYTVLTELAPDLPFIPIVKNDHPEHERLCASGIRYIGAEVLFTEDTAPVASPAFLDRMHRDGKLVWANAIIYNYKRQLSAGHSDDTSICGDPANGWGWLARHGFDFIQTDWTGMMIAYLKEQGLYYR